MPLKCYICIRRMDNCFGWKPIENLGVSKLSSRIVTLSHTVNSWIVCAQAHIVTQNHINDTLKVSQHCAKKGLKSRTVLVKFWLEFWGLPLEYQQDRKSTTTKIPNFFWGWSTIRRYIVHMSMKRSANFLQWSLKKFAFRNSVILRPINSNTIRCKFETTNEFYGT